ncbi:type I glyceraldehyde-3-phosphate dehydrogenase [Occultella gossypii]|uniref:Glyceraldehyde-3-phosphate dehydrogenase n=1 Tax=Occultella gossypii TaxID=2800820 RepID=A0ABS7S7M4_9MICO|nr:type I glyceraldehyde-3-phosphate dehydrogenase [Occultella gossypii]MBZ2196351.1 type I glyceraldehyde-3-phosphate dehydrogenase [Occultella gossypii]
MPNVAINGLGRIGRAALRILTEQDGIDVVAVNDIAPADNLAYLLGYDSTYGKWGHEVTSSSDALLIDGKRLPIFAERDPAALPWKDLGVDLVLECTGVFTAAEDLRKHLDAGSRFAILSAPTKSPDLPTVVHGVNSPEGDVRMFSCASCTTNAIGPVIEVLHRRIGVQDALMTTVHAYTASQAMVDGPSKNLRMGRAGAVNMIPTSTGAAIATTKAIPELRDHFDGVSIRVPVPVGSIADIVFIAERDTSVEEVNGALEQEAATDRYQGVLGYSTAPLVSSDIIGDARGSIVDADLTRVIGGRLVKVMAWYDNEWGFTNQMIRQARQLLGVDPVLD